MVAAKINIRSILFVTASIIMLSCNNNKLNQQDKSQSLSDSMVVADTFKNLEKFIGAAKWLYYCNCADTGGFYMVNYRLEKFFTNCAMFERRFDGYRIDQDTVIMYMTSIYKSKHLVDTIQYRLGIAYNIKSMEPVFTFTDNDDTRKSYVFPIEYKQYDDTLKHNIICFIQTYSDVIHPWFRQEAQKRGVFDKKVNCEGMQLLQLW